MLALNLTEYDKRQIRHIRAMYIDKTVYKCRLTIADLREDLVRLYFDNSFLEGYEDITRKHYINQMFIQHHACITGKPCYGYGYNIFAGVDESNIVKSCLTCKHSSICKYKDNAIKIEENIDELKRSELISGTPITLETNVVCKKYINRIEGE